MRVRTKLDLIRICVEETPHRVSQSSQYLDVKAMEATMTWT